MAVNIHITIIELNALHTKRQNLFQELDAVIHLLMEAKHWGLRKSRNATRSEERFSRNAETDLVCRLLLEKKKQHIIRLKDHLKHQDNQHQPLAPALDDNDSLQITDAN